MNKKSKIKYLTAVCNTGQYEKNPNCINKIAKIPALNTPERHRIAGHKSPKLSISYDSLSNSQLQGSKNLTGLYTNRVK